MDEGGHTDLRPWFRRGRRAWLGRDSRSNHRGSSTGTRTGSPSAEQRSATTAASVLPTAIPQVGCRVATGHADRPGSGPHPEFPGRCGDARTPRRQFVDNGTTRHRLARA
ncbi:Uncharacterised protein [Amycolatopsis camponoti]|uniref:Uncharacterized protein n=1 Tax=Amycolatopsis camponoti TaxID=2606593 RepID=A0A6I8M0G0_9PSEU|nr:Uncharacterised protein [Amycolatopsis camponoti]